MKIISNYHPRPVLSAFELSPRELSRNDIEPESSDSFFRYRGEVYSLSDFQRINPAGSQGGAWAFYDHENAYSKWNGIMPESAFSAIVIRLSDDGEEIIAGLALS